MSRKKKEKDFSLDDIYRILDESMDILNLYNLTKVIGVVSETDLDLNLYNYTILFKSMNSYQVSEFDIMNEGKRDKFIFKANTYLELYNLINYFMACHTLGIISPIKS